MDNLRERLQSDDCKHIYGYINSGVYRCTDIYVKLGSKDKINDEYDIYKLLEKSKAHSLFIKSPTLYTDDKGFALIFDNDVNCITVCDILKKQDVKLFVELLPRIINMIIELNNLGVTHGDPNVGNILYNTVNHDLKFIDVEYVSFYGKPFDAESLTSSENFYESYTENIEYHVCDFEFLWKYLILSEQIDKNKSELIKILSRNYITYKCILGITF